MCRGQHGRPGFLRHGPRGLHGALSATDNTVNTAIRRATDNTGNTATRQATDNTGNTASRQAADNTVNTVSRQAADNTGNTSRQATDNPGIRPHAACHRCSSLHNGSLGHSREGTPGGLLFRNVM